MFSKFIVIFVLVIAMLIAGCSGSSVPEGKEKVFAVPSSVTSSQNPTNGMVQSHDGGSVTINIEWIGVENDSLMLKVAMNTHSVDLDGYDLAELAILRDDEGNEYHASSWDSAAGGHHRQGLLSFPVPPSLNQGTTDYIEMIIHNIAGIDERVLKWDL